MVFQPSSDDSVSKPLADRRLVVRTLVRITLYYAAIALALFVLFKAFPGFAERLPIGGVEDIAAYDESYQTFQEGVDGEITVTPFRDSRGGQIERFEDAINLFLAMSCVMFLMLPVAWVYRAINYLGDHDHSLDETAFVLPVVVAGIVIVVQHSLALAFSLAGIVAGVRFRRALKDTYDALYILLAIGVGIAAGVQAVDIALVLSVFFNYTTVLVCAYGDGLESHHKRSERLQAEERKAAKKRLEKTDRGQDPAA